MEWLVRLVFRVARNTFKQDELNRSLGIPILDDTSGVEIYGREPRVHVANRKGPWQEVWMLVHRYSEIDTPAFRAFLERAVGSFHDNLNRMNTRPEDVMPWKVNGERWHLSEKGFPPGRKMRWDRAILPQVLDLVRGVEPKVEIAWDNRVTITFRVPGATRAWAQFRTKDCEGLDCRFLGKKGQFNLSRIEKFGISPALKNHREGEMLHLVFQHDHHLHGNALRELLREHLQGFREVWG
jgi:excinuclease ABC subunit A